MQAAAQAGDPVLYAGAEALAALGASWDGEPETSRPEARTRERAPGRTRRRGAGRAAGGGHVRRRRPAPVRASRARGADGRPRDRHRAPQWPDPAAGDALRAAHDRADACRLELDEALRAAEAAEETARLQGIPHLLHFALWIRGPRSTRRAARRREAERVVRDAARAGRGAASRASSPTRRGSTWPRSTPRRSRSGRCARCSAADGPELAHTDPTTRSRAVPAAGPRRAGAGPDRRRGGMGRAPRPPTATGCGCRSAPRAPRARAPRSCSRAARPPRRRGSRTRRARTPRPSAPAPTRSTRSCWPAARSAAEEPLQRVVAEAGRAGARRLHDAAARELRRIGSRPSGRARRAAERGDSALSAREQEIARLVAEGKLEQAGGGDALSEREDRRERAHADLRQARRALTRRAEPPPPPRRASGRRAGR